MPAVTNMTQKDLLEVVPPFIAEGSSAMVRLLELPPGDPGLAPHRHSGPVFGYMLEGEMLFELEGQAPYPIKAGEAFWEPGGDVIHYTVANLLADKTSRFVVVMLCAPGVEIATGTAGDEHGIEPDCGGRTRAALSCTGPGSGFSISAGQRSGVTVLAVIPEVAMDFGPPVDGGKSGGALATTPAAPWCW